MDQFFWERTGYFDVGRLLCRLPDGVWLVRNPRFLDVGDVEQSAVLELPAGDGDKSYLLSQRALLKLIERNAISFDWTQLYFFEGERALPAAGFSANHGCQLALHCVDGSLWQVESDDPELVQYLAGTEAGFHPGGTWREMPRYPVIPPLHPPAAEQTLPPLTASLARPLGAQEVARIRQGWEQMFVLGREIDVATDVAKPLTLGSHGGSRFGLGASRHDFARAEQRLGFALPEEIKTACREFNGLEEGMFQRGEHWHFAEVDLIHWWLLDFRDEVAQCPPFSCALGTRPPEFGPRLIPFAIGPDHTAYCLDYQPGDGGTPGQVSAVCFDDASVAVVAGSYAEFLEQQIVEHEKFIERIQAPAGKQEKLPNEISNLGCLGYLLLLPFYGLIVLAWRLLRRLIPRGPREALEDKLRPWAEKRKFYALIPERKLPKKQRIAALPGSITALWYEIEDLNRARDKSVKWMFKPGADEKYLHELEAKLRFALPPDLRELFIASAACNLPFGGNEHDDRYTGFDSSLIPYILEQMQLELADGYKLRLYPGTRYPEPGPRLVPIGGGNTLWKPLMQLSVLCYDLNPGAGGAPGQIVHVDVRKHSCRVVAPSLHAWLAEGLERLKRDAR